MSKNLTLRDAIACDNSVLEHGIAVDLENSKAEIDNELARQLRHDAAVKGADLFVGLAIVRTMDGETPPNP